MRPLGFLVLMLGLGLRLDTTWQGTATALLAVGAALGLAGLFGGGPRAFVQGGGGE